MFIYPNKMIGWKNFHMNYHQDTTTYRKMCTGGSDAKVFGRGKFRTSRKVKTEAVRFRVPLV